MCLSFPSSRITDICHCASLPSDPHKVQYPSPKSASKRGCLSLGQVRILKLSCPMHVENKRKGKGHGVRHRAEDIYKNQASRRIQNPLYLFCKVVSKMPENNLKEVWLLSSLSVASAPDSMESCSSVECHDDGMWPSRLFLIGRAVPGSGATIRCPPPGTSFLLLQPAP